MTCTMCQWVQILKLCRDFGGTNWADECEEHVRHEGIVMIGGDIEKKLVTSLRVWHKWVLWNFQFWKKEEKNIKKTLKNLHFLYLDRGSSAVFAHDTMERL